VWRHELDVRVAGVLERHDVDEKVSDPTGAARAA
jgi:hypothetical protein